LGTRRWGIGVFSTVKWSDPLVIFLFHLKNTNKNDICQ